MISKEPIFLIHQKPDRDDDTIYHILPYGNQHLEINAIYKYNMLLKNTVRFQLLLT